MHVQSGSYRTVVTIPSVRLAIKIPRIRVREFVSNVRFHLSRFIEGKGSLELFWAYTFVKGVDTYCTGKRALFKGLVDNWREWRFCSETRNPVLTPTRIWCGVSFQRQVDPIGVSTATFIERMQSIIGDAVFTDSHHLANPGNFGILDGHFVVVDYASPTVQAILRTHGDRLLKEFDIHASP